MPTTLAGRCVLLGASSGIGAAVARQVAGVGAILGVLTSRAHIADVSVLEAPFAVACPTAGQK